MSIRKSDYTFHPPSGSNVPGKEDANIYMNYPPDSLRALITTEEDPEELAKIKSALKQWERQFQDIGYPFKKVAARLRLLAAVLKRAEIVGPPQNIPYYFDSEVPSGVEEVIDSMRGQYDNDNARREDIPRQGERPIRDIDTGVGDFLSPKDPIFQNLKPSGDGVDPEGMDVPFPPTGGDIEGWPEGI